MSPIIKQVDELIYEKRIDKRIFLCELAERLGIEPTDVWLTAGYRWFSSDITPREQTSKAITAWLKANKNRKVTR